jgi:5-methylcytosine-specific restriction enzyme subunit McrC
MGLEMKEPLQLIDNRYDDPENGGAGEDISQAEPHVKTVLSLYDGKYLDDWASLGVTVFPSQPLLHIKADDYAHRDLSFFTLGRHSSEMSSRQWINTHNCMGVVRLRDKESGEAVQIEIGSRFDEGHEKPFFLSYLLSKVFGGSIVDHVDLGKDSLWDMLLAFVFRRRLLEAHTVGIFKQYRTFHHNDTRIRGRIDVDRHLRRNIPFCGNVAYATHEITYDNPTNHLIRHALAKVRRKWGGLLTGDGRLTELRHQLEQNTPTWEAGNVQACIRRKENRTPIRHPFFHAAYEPLRYISLAILNDEGASLYQKRQEAEGVIFDGSWLWEEYLWTLLKPLGFEHPENKKGRGAWEPLDGVKFIPDFFHIKNRVVLNAKYKREKVKQEDVKQIFSYMFQLNALHGGLVKPDGNAQSKPKVKIKWPIANAQSECWWHELALPPSAEADSARDFIKRMGEIEDGFSKAVRMLENPDTSLSV